MHPAFSVLFFTVTSGFGFGFLFWLLLAQHTSVIALTNDELILSIGAATAMFTLGLMSSSLHLANPKNAWRSFTRFASSWLSREAVFAVLTYPLLAVYVATIWFEVAYWDLVLASLLCVLLLILIYCTAMIYASLKTIPQWNNRWVISGFLCFSLASGALCLTVVVHNSLTVMITAGLLILSLLIKLGYYRHIGLPDRSSINTATGFSQASVKLFDAGHSSKNFLQREFVYEVGPKTKTLARRTSLLMAFILPALLLVWLAQPVAAALCCYLGLLLERWLFFVEAKHVIRHYYDASR
ncbi:MAG: DmsC/YnfH family molybdoenzyme membrane anchor subunit [Pseudomonadota bacterium]